MFDIKEADIDCLQNAMCNKEVTSVELVLMYMERIMKYDKDGPLLNSILEINPDALFIANALDHERNKSGIRSRLHGIPILLKDNINTKDKMHTSAGCLALADNYAPDDAFFVNKLRKEGAVILGKTNMTEFANFMAKGMPNGYSSRGGQVINPYDASRDPSGSSSGSAVAAASSFCAAAVGTETCGSIIGPAVMNCVVGIKPTVGAVSRSGVIPISNSQDTAGPITRTVMDAAIMLGAMTGFDQSDPATWAGMGRTYTDYTQFLDKNGLKGTRIGINNAHGENIPKDKWKAIYNAIGIMKKHGAVIVDGADLEFSCGDSLVLLYEFKQCIDSYLSSLKTNFPVRSLKDIIEYNNNNPKEALKYGQEILLRAQTTGTLADRKYLNDKIRDMRCSRKEGIDRSMDELQLDVILCTVSADIAAVAGYPSITVPAGMHEDGSPFGAIFIGKAYTEAVLLKTAYAFEQAVKGRIPPVFD